MRTWRFEFLESFKFSLSPFFFLSFFLFPVGVLYYFCRELCNKFLCAMLFLFVDLFGSDMLNQILEL